MKNLQLIEYPGIVNNVDNMISSLGGINAINLAFDNMEKIELNRNKTCFSYKPIVGDVKSSYGLLLKVKVRKSKKNPDQKTYITTISGVIEKSCHFTKMCDFQFFPYGKTKENSKLRDCSEFIMPRKSLLDEKLLADDSVPYFLPAPIFSRINVLRSKYRAKIKKQQKSYIINIPFNAKEIPLNPKENVQNIVKQSQLHLDCYELLKELFTKRPIHSIKAIYSLTTISKESLIETLPLVAYKFMQGPWRRMYVRIGYDPRKNPESAIYQLIEIKKFDSSMFRLSRRNFHLIMKRNDASLSRQNTFSMSELRQNSHILKPGMVQKTTHITYQLCDIHIPSVQKLIEEYQSKLRKVCHEKFGWFDEQFMLRFRAIIQNVFESDLKKYNNGDCDNDENKSKDINVEELNMVVEEQDLVDKVISTDLAQDSFEYDYSDSSDDNYEEEIELTFDDM